ncbi:CHRD domain-containing protein [Streptomyces sp. ISL-96]|uniref:CHRD domain-containing protein n=1 Tax=Streptomyces sp. ISL-96 TaxID=2819191 RepID=UPI001BE61351|nr:CHRD domain-containing protein [Streptomyces sp. ISL-96]MBT2492989.1 CHRD domain-containing protein [Streptomyces sp. ISL-96]
MRGRPRHSGRSGRRRCQCEPRQARRGQGRPRPGDLTGREEVPGPGDPDGSGEFWYQIKHGTLCYSLNVRKIAQPTAAHIHAGKRGVAGPVVVTLKTPTYGSSKGCIKAKPHQTTANAATVLTYRELKQIACKPGKFYANVHNNPYPDGAIRGQLRRQ